MTTKTKTWLVEAAVLISTFGIVFGGVMMTTKMKVWMIVAASLILSGGLLFCAVMRSLHWDFGKLSTVRYERNTYEITADFKDISIVTDTADVDIYPSEDGKVTVVCVEQEKMKHMAVVRDGVLTVEVKDTRAWHEYIGISFRKTHIRVYLPREVYGELSVKSSTGDIYVHDAFTFESIEISASTSDVTCWASAESDVKIKVTTGDITLRDAYVQSADLSVTTGKVSVRSVDCREDMHIRVSTGKLNLSDVSCGSLQSKGTTGDVTLKNVKVTDKISIQRTTGDVKFDDCDSGTIQVKTTTGDVEGKFLTPKEVVASTSTGKIDLPDHWAEGGPYRIKTSTGDIKIVFDSDV